MNNPSITIKNVTVFSKINFDRRIISKKKKHHKKNKDKLVFEI